jgi:hypothetical protein
MNAKIWWTKIREGLGLKPPARSLRVFISYDRADSAAVMRLSERLKADGVRTWLDIESIVPGEVWSNAIERAIDEADAMIVCLSQRSLMSASLSVEIRKALEMQSRRPEGSIFLVPVRLEECEVPFSLTRIHWVDLFRDGGYEGLLRVLRIRRPEELDLSQTIQIANRAKNVRDLSALPEIVRELPEGREGYLAQTALLKRRVAEIVSLQTRLDTLDRAMFREQVARSLKQQVSLSTGCPGVILYGRRRRGKSTVLRNLTGAGFLPDSILSAVISMQEPQAFSSLEGLLGRITGAVSEQARLVVGRRPERSAEPSYFRPVIEVRTLPDLYRFLGIWDTQLKKSDNRLVIAIDEYEGIDTKIGERIFPIDLLAMIRESIQSHRNITWIFSGSHDIDELIQADWTSFLVSARTVEVPCFTLAETRILLTDPLQHSSFWNATPEKRPRFLPDFWGRGGIERIHEEAGGWPHLVQLLAETYVDLINEREPSEGNLVMDRCITEAVDRARTVLSQLMRGESRVAAEWEYLLRFRERQSQPPPDDTSVARSLKRRDIVVEGNGLWQLRVPLMLRWLHSYG